MCRSRVRPSVCLSRLFYSVNRARGVFFPTLILQAANTQRDSPAGSTRRVQCVFSSDDYEDIVANSKLVSLSGEKSPLILNLYLTLRRDCHLLNK